MTKPNVFKFINNKKNDNVSASKLVDAIKNVKVKPYNRINQNILDKSLEIEKVIFNPPVTVIIWADRTKTVVRCQGGEPFDPEKGMVMAFMKKARGNTGGYFKEVSKWCKPYYQKEIDKSYSISKEFADIAKNIRNGIRDASEALTELMKSIEKSSKGNE